MWPSPQLCPVGNLCALSDSALLETFCTHKIVCPIEKLCGLHPNSVLLETYVASLTLPPGKLFV